MQRLCDIRINTYARLFQCLWLTVYHLLSLLLLQCDAPRLNPLDPENPKSSLALIAGDVRTFSVPREAISGVEVQWTNDAFSVRSNSDGTFVMENLAPRDGWLFFEKPGFHHDSILVEWDNRRQVNIQRFLNAYPEIEGLQVFSVVTNKFPSIKEFTFSIRGTVTDRDNDIDTVYWRIPAFDVGGKLRFNAESQQYETDIDPLEQGLGNEQVVGYDFDVVVLDKFDQLTVVGSDQIERVIKEEVTLLSPLNDIAVGSRPQLRWQRFDPGFFFVFEIEILRDVPGELPELYRRYVDLQSTTENFTIPDDMDEGSYFWSVWVADEFNNRARSRVGSFRVVN